MNTDEVDHDAYRRWWEAEGRKDLSFCPCGNAVESWMEDGDPLDLHYVLSPGYGKCPRHRDLGLAREAFAQAIIDGTFTEHDATDDEIARAERVAAGKLPLDA